MHDSTADRMLRLNQESHSLAYINDDDHSTYWVSSLRDDILIEVDLGDQYEVKLQEFRIASSVFILFDLCS